MDGLEGRWYPSESGYGDRDRYDEDRYRLPEPRHAEPEPLAREPRLSSSIGPRSGVELPPLPTYEPDMPPPFEAPPPPFDAPEATAEHHTTPLDRGALRRPETPDRGPTVYKSRRAGALAVVLAVTVIAELLLVRVLLVGEFGTVVQPGAVLGSIFAMAGIPFVAVGLYALITGPSAVAGPEAVRGWLRTPLAYLPVGLVLLIAAGLAA